jgi:carboxymethylenebutenolidase
LKHEFGQDVQGLLPEKEFDRRDFLWSALGASAALALSSPASAQAITTDTAGIDAADVSIPDADGQSLRGYRAMPQGSGPFPVVLVAAEIFGLNPYIKDVCRRLAKAGYYAIVPDLYTPGRSHDVQEHRRDHADRQQQVRHRARLRLSRHRRLRARERQGDLNRMAITGFCRGGRTTSSTPRKTRG